MNDEFTEAQVGIPEELYLPGRIPSGNVATASDRESLPRSQRLTDWKCDWGVNVKDQEYNESVDPRDFPDFIKE